MQSRLQAPYVASSCQQPHYCLGILLLASASTVEMTLLGSLAYMIHSKYLDWSGAKAQRYKF